MHANIFRGIGVNVDHGIQSSPLIESVDLSTSRLNNAESPEICFRTVDETTINKCTSDNGMCHLMHSDPSSIDSSIKMNVGRLYSKQILWRNCSSCSSVYSEGFFFQLGDNSGKTRWRLPSDAPKTNSQYLLHCCMPLKDLHIFFVLLHVFF